MSKKLLKSALAAGLVVFHAGAPAEDIDLFAKIDSAAAQRPNILIILDNTANWNQAFDNEKSALVSLMSSLPVDRFNLGLMLFTESGGGNGSPSGAYVRAAVRQIDGDNKTRYRELFESLDKQNDKGDSASYGLAMAEAYRYFSGTDAYAGHNKVKRDYANNNVPGYPKSNVIYSLAGNALSGAASTRYNSPITANCQKNFVIFISNGASDIGENSGDQVNNLLKAAGGNTAVIPLSPDGRQVIVSDEWARFMAGTDINTSVAGVQTVTTYTVDINPSSSGQGPSNTALLKSMANQGKGSYFAVSSSGGGNQITEALLKIFSDIQAVNSAFASASLPVAVNAQGTYLNQVFVGMFRPDAKPRWYGNLKQYQFVAQADEKGNVTNIYLGDKNGNQALSATTGFIASCAESYWTSADEYWPAATGTCIGVNLKSNSPDGEVVEKGAAAQKLRLIAPADRTVKTSCLGCTGSGALDNFNTANTAITKTALGDGSMSDANRVNLINWIRGQNVFNELGKGTTAMRPSAHGDVVHSRPLAIDFGGSTGVVVFYGSNDGMLRAINGHKTDAATAGDELWAYVAPEHYSRFKRLADNSPLVDLPGVIASEVAPKDYFFDGAIGLHRDGSTTWIYPTMRRGGSHVYAFDVSTPASPTLKWKLGPTALDNVAQTWSKPVVVKVAGYPVGASTKSPIIIMGGGYDPCEDQDAVPNTACTAPKGNRVYVIDANTGTVLKTLGLGGGGGDAITHSVAADVTAIDSDFDGYVDVAYAVDTAANVYRIDIGSNEPANWTVKRIAALGCDSGACGRKFLFAPEVVVGTNFNTIMVGSGNRERPLLANAATQVDNAFFIIKDDRSQSQALITASTLVAVDPESGATVEQQAEITSPSNKGWYLAFGSGVCVGEEGEGATGCHDKEQVVTAAVAVAGKVYFSTHIPTEPTGCENLGIARGYAVSFQDAAPVDYSNFAGGGLAPSSVSGVVEVALTGVDGTPVTGPGGAPVTVKVPFVTGSPGGTGPLDPAPIIDDPSGVRSRVYWYIQQ